MPAPRPPAAPLASLLSVAASMLLAGCGSGGPDAAAVKSHLTTVADAVDRCVAKTNDARRCVGVRELAGLPGDVELGTGVGQVEIQATRPLRYALEADAGDDGRFSVIAAPVGARERRCQPAGQGDCPEGGAW